MCSFKILVKYSCDFVWNIINSYPIDGCMRQPAGPALVQVKVYRPFGARPLTIQILT